MKKLILSIVALLFFVTSYSQVRSDSITVAKKFGTVFQQYGRNLTPAQLKQIVSVNPEAAAEMKKANANTFPAFAFSYAGGFMIGWPIGTALAGGKANWTLAGIGAGLVLLAIPFSTAYTSHAKNAVRIYNRGLLQTCLPVPEIRLGLLGNGIGLRIRF
jgi:hypothetical protein